MQQEETLQPIITVKGTETTPELYIRFIANFKKICYQTFLDGKYVSDLFIQQLTSSISSHDKTLLDYYLLEKYNEREFD